MHNLLEKLGREIDRAKSKGDPGKRRFLEDAEEILDVFTDKTGTRNVLGIIFDMSQIRKPFISINEKSFEGMLNLQYLHIHDHSKGKLSECRLHLPNGLVYLPRKLKRIDWNYCPLKSLPCNFKAEYLVELIMENSELEKLWEGTQLLGSLKTMIMRHSRYLKEIPDLSKAINLERLDISCCVDLTSFPIPLNSESLEYLNLLACPRMKNFPNIEMRSSSDGIEINVGDGSWNNFLPGLDYLNCLKSSNPSKFCSEHLVSLRVKGYLVKKLWEGVQSLGSLVRMDLSDCPNLTKIPDLSKATNLEYLILSNCKKLVVFPSTIRNLQKLMVLEMKECTGLKVLPADVNLSSLEILDLRGCSSLESFPQISKRTYVLKLDGDTRERILESCFKSTMVLPGGEVPTCFKYRVFGNSISFRLPQTFCFEEFLRVDTCVVVEPALADFSSCMTVHIKFNGKRYMHTIAEGMPPMCKADHLVLCSFKFRPTGLPIRLPFNNDVEFKFSYLKRIKKFGIRLLNASSYQNGDRSYGSYETKSENNSYRSYKTEKYYVKPDNRKKRMPMTLEISEGYLSLPLLLEKSSMLMALEKCEEYINLPATGQGESYPYLEEAMDADSMITKQQDAQIPIVETLWS